MSDVDDDLLAASGLVAVIPIDYPNVVEPGVGERGR